MAKHTTGKENEQKKSNTVETQNMLLSGVTMPVFIPENENECSPPPLHLRMGGGGGGGGGTMDQFGTRHEKAFSLFVTTCSNAFTVMHDA